MKTKMRDQKSKIFAGSIITSSALLLSLYVNNGNIVKADSLAANQTSNEIGTESGSSSDLNGTAGTNGSQTSSTNESDSQPSQNENGTTEASESQTSQTTNQEQVGTRSLKSFNWGGLEITLSDDGVLTIPGGTVSLSGTLNDPIALRDVLLKDYGQGQNYINQTNKIKITGKLKIIGSAAGLFSYFSNVTEISGLDQLDTSEITNMRQMFYGCVGLTKIDVSHFDTRKVTDMSDMFSMPGSLIKTKDTTIGGGYEYALGNPWASNLMEIKGLDSINFKTSNVTNMYAMFNGCWRLTSLDVSKFDTSKVSNMSYMFCRCTNLAEIDVSNFDTSNVNTMSGMFFACASFTELNLKNFDMTNVVEDSYKGYSGMLSGMYKLKILTLGPKMKIKNSNLINPVNANNDVMDNSDRLCGPVKRSALSYRSRWINLRGGDFIHPNGKNKWTARQMQLKYDGANGDADTYYRYGSARSQYHDEDGNEIVPDEVVMNIVGETYTAPAEKDLAGYTYKEMKGAASTGIYDDDEKVVTYIYTKNANNPDNPVVPIVKSKVTVTYQDENGNRIAPDEVLTGKVGDGYQTEQKSIFGYTFKEVKGNVTGFFATNDQTVTYIYTKNSIETINTTESVKHNKPRNQSIEKPKESQPLANEPKNKEDLLPRSGTNEEDKGILSVLGGMMLLISTVGGAWLNRKQK